MDIDNMSNEELKELVKQLSDENTLLNLKIDTLRDSVNELIEMGKSFVQEAQLALRG